MKTESFAVRLKRIRNERGYTQEQLARITLISVQTIRNYEQGHNEPISSYLLDLAQALDITPEYLLKGSMNMNTYTNAIKTELSQINNFEQLVEIKNENLNATVLPHLELSEELVSDIKDAWEGKNLFVQSKTCNDKVLFEKSYCTRNYVREIILRYCQNRVKFKKKFSIKDGMIINSKDKK